MQIPEEQVQELAAVFRGVLRCEEGGFTFFLIPKLTLPAGSTPAEVDVLLCPMERDGYVSRLFFAERVSSSKGTLNWNSSLRILERNWQAFSWRTRSALRLVQMVAEHLRALRQ